MKNKLKVAHNVVFLLLFLGFVAYGSYLFFTDKKLLIEMGAFLMFLIASLILYGIFFLPKEKEKKDE